MILSRLPFLAWYAVLGAYGLTWGVVAAGAALSPKTTRHPDRGVRFGGARRRRWGSILSVGTTGMLAVLAVLLLAFSMSGYGAQRTLVNSLAADGVADQFTTERAQLLGAGAGLVAVVLLASAAASWIWRTRFATLTLTIPRRLAQILAGLSADFRQMLEDLVALRADRGQLLGLAALTTLGALLRLAYLQQPIRYDEAYSFLEYASRGLEYAISAYTLPNNHLLHTALMTLTTGLLGDSLAVIRLPAFLAGLATVPMGYLAARCLYGRKAALLTAGLISVSSGLIEYSTNARGYSLVCLFAVALVGLGAYVRRKPNGAAWLLLATVGALGLFTVPTMLFPLGAVFLWLGISGLRHEPKQSSRAAFLSSLIAAAMAMGLLTVALYLPALAMSGVRGITGARAIAAVGWDRTAGDLVQLLGDTVGFWSRDVPTVVAVVVGAGLLAYLVVRREIEDTRFSLAAAVLWWSGAVTLALRRVTLKAGVWLFLLPLVFMWASAGLASLFERISWGSARRKNAAFSLAVLLTSIVLGAGVIQSGSVLTSTETGTFRSAEEVVTYLGGILRPGDRVVAHSPSDYPMRYYFERHNLDESYLFQRGQPIDFHRALVIVNTTSGQSLLQILEKAEIPAAPDPASIHTIERFEDGMLIEVLLSPQAVSSR